MADSKAKIKIKVSEVANLLGWPYTTAKSIKDRKSPKDKYQIYLDCEEKLKKMKENFSIELSKH